MSEISLVQSSSYQSLIFSVKKSLSAGLLRAQKAIEYERLKTYWQIGRAIRQEVDASQGHLQTNQNLYRQISQDVESEMGLQLTQDTLQRLVQFHKLYPVFPKDTPLTFTHYRNLLRVEDARVRQRLEAKAIQKNFSVVDLKLEIDSQLQSKIKFIEDKVLDLKIERGEPYVYQTKMVTELLGQKNLCLDCGFKLKVPIEGKFQGATISTSTQTARFVRVVKEEGQYHVKLHKAGRDKLYTYVAKVTKVVDGDTIDALVDVGFGMTLLDRFRLKGINAPEMKTAKGIEVRSFLVKKLKKCPLMIIRTTKEGMYGRWLADIFVLEGSADPYRIAAEGECLNQVLLEKGLAEVYLKK